MKKFLLPAVIALAASTAPAAAADLGRMVTKAPPPAPVSPWDIGFGAGIASDYNFRGISQSDRGVSPYAYFEPRYNVSKSLQLYAGIAGYGVDLASNPSAEVDLYGGIRPTFGALALDLGFIYYWYPKEKGHSGDPTVQFPCYPNGNCVLADTDFWEVYGKGTYTFNDNLSAFGSVYYSPDWLNTGASGTYASIGLKYLGTPLSSGWNWFLSGEVGHYWLGTPEADPFVWTPPLFNVNLPDYLTWNVGLAFTYKVFTLDFRYYDTDLSKEECNYLTADPTAAIGGNTTTPGNPAGLQSKWCNPAFIVKLSADLTLDSLK
jgi:uncharacterized protein (TIGR02001 family)